MAALASGLEASDPSNALAARPRVHGLHRRAARARRRVLSARRLLGAGARDLEPAREPAAGDERDQRAARREASSHRSLSPPPGTAGRALPYRTTLCANRNPAGTRTSAHTSPATDPSAPTAPRSASPSKRHARSAANPAAVVSAVACDERPLRLQRRCTTSAFPPPRGPARGVQKEHRLVDGDPDEHRQDERVVHVPAQVEDAHHHRHERDLDRRPSRTARTTSRTRPSAARSVIATSDEREERDARQIAGEGVFRATSRWANPVMTAAGVGRADRVGRARFAAAPSRGRT